MKERNSTIDLLRVIGIVLVIASHSYFPEAIEELICFDVVLLVFVAGYSFMSSSFIFSKENYWEYVFKRFKKLILPVWLVVIVWYILFGLILKDPISMMTLGKSFFLLAGGMSFIWVYRVFFTSSLLMPFLKKVVIEKGKWILLGCLILIQIGNDLLFQFVFSNMGTIGKVLEYLITYTIGYLFISMVGMLSVGFERKEKIFTALLFGLLTTIGKLIIQGETLLLYKHPPFLIYSSYGLAISLLLYLLLNHVKLEGNMEKGVVWFSKNARSIYLWHALIYYLLVHFNVSLPSILMWLLLLCGGILLTYFEQILLRTWRKKHV